MLRIKCAMAVAALLLLLQSPLSFAAESGHQAISALSTKSMGAPTQGGEVSPIAASTINGEGDQLSRDNTAGRQEQAQANVASTPAKVEYPALALLATAIISMAALSRRDSFRIDR